MASYVKDFSLDGRVALVTGGSRGIGEAIAEVFVEAGAKVMLTARHEDGLKQVVERLPEGTAAYRAANASDPASAQLCADATMATFGRLDILVNNAGSNPAHGPLLELSVAQIDKTVAVNQRGPLLYTQAAAKAWMAEHGGVVVNISSLGAYLTTRNMTIYAMTKAALVKQTQGLALELAPKIRVVGMAPGMIETTMMRGLSDVGERAASIPLRRIGEPRECALLALFLASDAAAFITGTTILIDGGSSLR